MNDRFTGNSEYLYSFNGMEKDNEIQGEGNSLSTQFRQYDPRIARWLSLDPLMAKYPGQSPYAGFNNNPIYYADPTGLEGVPGGPPITGQESSGDTKIYGGKCYEMTCGTEENGYQDSWQETNETPGTFMLRQPRHARKAYDYMWEQQFDNPDAEYDFSFDNETASVTRIYSRSSTAIVTSVPETFTAAEYNNEGAASYTPVLGSGIDAYNDFADGNIGYGLINSAVAISDVFMVKALFVGISKFSVSAIGKASLGSNGKAIVLGEGMGAVKSTAKTLQSQGINAKWYQAWSKNFPTNRLMTPAEFDAALARNSRWLNSKIDKGYKIYDIGIDATRATRSPFYELEQRILLQRGYPTTKLPR